MARFCKDCGKKLSLFSSEALCKQCKINYESEISKIDRDILDTKEVTDHQLAFLKKSATVLKKNELIRLYFKMYKQFESDKELEEKEIEALEKIQKAFNLTNEDIKYDEYIIPYIYANSIKEGKLPLVKLHVESGGQVILKKDETVHFAYNAVLKELRSVSLGYRGGSHGISIRIAKGVRYRVGAHRGHIVKEDRFVETSRGVLIVTNKRLILHPFPGYKPLSISLNKILSYNCFNNGIEIYKEGREKSYFLAIDKSSSIEIFGLCLGHLLVQ